LLTTTAGKLRVGSTDAGIAFAPVYSMGASVSIIGGMFLVCYIVFTLARQALYH
jgi:hypothetical protein